MPEPLPPEVPLFDADGALSREYLLHRGFCCRNGCRNCPYGFRRDDPDRAATEGQRADRPLHGRYSDLYFIALYTTPMNVTDQHIAQP